MALRHGFRRARWLGLEAEQRAVFGVAEPDHAVSADVDAISPLGSHVGAVGAAPVLKHPGPSVCPQDGVPPGHARVGQHDVRGRVAPDAVLGAAFQPVIGAPRPYQQRWRGIRFLCHLITHRRIPSRLLLSCGCIYACLRLLRVLGVYRDFSMSCVLYMRPVLLTLQYALSRPLAASLPPGTVSPTVRPAPPVSAHVPYRTGFLRRLRSHRVDRLPGCHVPLSVGRGREIRNLVNYNCEGDVLNTGLILIDR
jgi:hypothetical protein